jgi:glucokinase
MGLFVLGIDLGGTKINGAVFNQDYQIIGRAFAKTEAWRNDEEVFQRIVRVGNEALADAGIEPSQLTAIGIGSPGPLDYETGYIIETANLKFKNFPLGPRLSESFNCPVIIENDVNAGTYGELKAGAARGAKDVLGVFIGTGIGGGIIINGMLHHGFNKNAGEVGHIIIEVGGPRCGCGNRGCWEALASRTAMARDIRKAVKKGEKTVLTKMLGKRIREAPSHAIREAYEEGDELVKKVVRRAAKYIGIGIGSLVNVLNPEVVVLGGGVIEALGVYMMEIIERNARSIAFEFAIKDVRFAKAELGDDAGIIGAAMLAREALARPHAEVEV